MRSFYLKWLTVCSLLAAIPGAFGQSRVIINGGFEPPQTNNLPASSYSLLRDADNYSPEVEGWKTTASTSRIEVWSNNYRGFSAAQGNQFAELNSTEAARLYQDVCLSSGETLNWKYYHRGRTSASVPDVSQLNLYNSTGTSKILVLESASDENSAWGYYSGSKTLTLPSGMYQFSFEAISTANGDLTTGNFLDGVQIDLVPFTEFTSPTQTGQENLGNNLPKLRVNGLVPAGGSIITLTITGGTATNNVDYTLTTTVTIPSGYYPPTTAINIPLTIIDDALLEGNETVQIRIISATNTMLITDANCDGTNGRNTVYTITDNEALPVEFISFDIHLQGKYTLLEWQTANEINNKGFIIERSTDGYTFDSVGFAPPLPSNYRYSFKDIPPTQGKYYYRIKQLDFDGNSQNSMVRISNSGSRNTWYAYPNPFIDKLKLAGGNGIAKIEIWDMYGKLLVEMDQVDTLSPVDFAWLISGTYILGITQQGETHKTTICKMD
ncbi:MAG: T9SS type A sorting domain-containing protein [Cytophagales bacterium]|nr:T9SS type A sorting domain-containing protein [Cytophagales bacterium]